MKSNALIMFALLTGSSFAFAADKRPVVLESITPGSEQEARKYYDDLTAEFGIATSSDSSLSDLVAFTGYPLTAEQLETLDPAVLMSPERIGACDSSSGPCVKANGLVGGNLRSGDILAARFFAPKIACVATAKPNPGWRKLVRLRTRPDSQASKAGIESVIILFNFFGPTGSAAFSGHSANTQVMLLAPAHEKRLYWMDFDSAGKLSFALPAFFDAGLTGCETRKYFVPNGCNACHGSPGNLRPPMVNYLDTDHWFDRLDDDFAGVTDPLLFDAGTNDPNSPAFARALDVIRQFNEEALRQNNLVHHESFETEAARTWLRIHATSSEHVPPVARGFSTTAGPKWQPGEKDGLRLLNQFCFRCHGSIRFSVFDRPTVLDKTGNMQQRVNPSATQMKIPGFKMPPDRVLTPDEISALEDFLKKIE